MDWKIEIIPRLLHFKQPAGTSRGVYTTRKVWYLHLTSPDYPGRTGIGECAPLPALSCDDLPDYAPTFSEIDISLSLRTTSISGRISPA